MRGEGRDYTLVVSDYGVGMPGDVDYRESGPSGLQLVNTLIGQLEGSISPGEGGGTAFTIKFIDMK